MSKDFMDTHSPRLIPCATKGSVQTITDILDEHHLRDCRLGCGIPRKFRSPGNRGSPLFLKLSFPGDGDPRFHSPGTGIPVFVSRASPFQKKKHKKAVHFLLKKHTCVSLGPLYLDFFRQT